MLLHAILTRMVRHGALAVRYPDGAVRRYGGARPGPEAAVEIRTPRALWRLALNPGLALGEGYMDGEVVPLGCGIYDLLDLLMLNMETGGAHPTERARERGAAPGGGSTSSTPRPGRGGTRRTTTT